MANKLTLPASRWIRLEHIVCLALLCFLVWLRWQFALHSISMLPAWSANDGPYWLAAVVEWSNGHGFSNSLTNFYTEAHWRDGEYSLVAYPPLHMLLLAALTAAPDVYGAYKAVWILEAIGLLLLCAALVTVVYRTGQQHRIGIWALVWLGIACAGVLGFSGRPETTFVMVLSLGCIYAAMSDRPNAFVVGLILGVLGAIQPLAAMLIASCVIIWFSMLWETGQLVRRLMVVVATSVTVLLVAISTYYTAADVLGALTRNAPLQFYQYFSMAILFKAQFLDYYRPLSGIVLLVGVASAVALIMSKRPASAMWLLLGVLSFILLSCFSFIIRPHNNYNAQVLYPLAILLTVAGASMRKRAGTLPALVLVLPALALPLQALLLYDHMQRGMTLQAAQAIYSKVVKVLPSEAILGIETTLWPLSADGRDWGRSYHPDWEGPHNRGAHGAALFVREGSAMNRGNSLLQGPKPDLFDPDRGVQHRLLLNCNTQRLLKVLGREIYTPVLGFAFAVYVPTHWGDWCPSGSQCHRELGSIQSCVRGR